MMAEATNNTVITAENHVSGQPPRQHRVIGCHEAASFGGGRLRDNVARLIQQSSDIGNYTLDGMSTVPANTSLSYSEWALVTISTLIALGDCMDQLDVYVEGAIKHGVEVEEILDLINHAQSARRELPQAYTESLVRIGDHDTMIRDTHGEEVPIILIHTLCLDSKMHKFILPAIHKATGARVIAYDMRGHGHARGAPPTQNLEHLCMDLERLYDTLGIETADIYGRQSYTSPGHKSRNGGGKWSGTLPSRIYIRWFHPKTIAVNPWYVRYARHCVERARVEEWTRAWRAMSELSTLPRLGELTIPVMSLSGTHDASSIPSIMRQIVDACTNAEAEFVSVERGTHMMMMEQSDDCAEKLVAFRKKVDSKYGS